MRTGGVRYGIELDTLSYILLNIVGKIRHKTNACAVYAQMVMKNAILPHSGQSIPNEITHPAHGSLGS